MSYHLTAFELTNQLLCMNFPSLERKIFPKDLKSTLPSSVALCFVTSVISDCNATYDGNVDFTSLKKNPHSELGKLMYSSLFISSKAVK